MMMMTSFSLKLSSECLFMYIDIDIDIDIIIYTNASFSLSPQKTDDQRKGLKQLLFERVWWFYSTSL